MHYSQLKVFRLIGRNKIHDGREGGVCVFNDGKGKASNSYANPGTCRVELGIHWGWNFILKPFGHTTANLTFYILINSPNTFLCKLSSRNETFKLLRFSILLSLCWTICCFKDKLVSSHSREMNGLIIVDENTWLGDRFSNFPVT